MDDKRQISDEDKIAIFTNHSGCEMCKAALKDFREAEYHHKELFSEGGKTEKDNIMVLCGDCHDLIHGRKKIDIPTENDLTEDEE